MKQKSQFFKTGMLLLVILFGSANSNAQTLLYANDFESGENGSTIIGNGVIEASGDANHGMVFHNSSGGQAIRANYLKLPSSIFSDLNTAGTNALSISFWVNKGTASNYYWSTFFSAYGAAPSGGTNTGPMFAIFDRGWAQVNTWDGNWSDFNATHTESTTWIDGGDWKFFTITITKTSVKTYIDGVVWNSWAMNSGNGTSTDGLFSIGSGLNYICLGGNAPWNWEDPDPAFLYDKLKIYAGELTTDQITSLYATDQLAAAAVGSNKTNLYLDDKYTTESFVVNGVNLSNDINITVPNGITVSPTIIASSTSTNVTVNVTYDGSTSVSGNITLTSGDVITNVAVKASSNAGCYTNAYSQGNMIADPTFSAIDLTTGGFAGWGPTGISTKNTYCGRGSAYILGSCWPNGGSVDRALTTVNGNALQPLTKYRLRAMVNSKASNGTYFQFQVEGVDGDGGVIFQLPNSNGWKQIDTTFTTGSTVTEHGIYFNSCSASTPLVTDTCFIDNYELYAVPISNWAGTGTLSESTKWDSSPVPGSDVNVTNGELNIDQNIILNDMTLAPDSKVMVNPGKTLSAKTLNINSDDTGTATFVNNGISTVTRANIKQYLTSGRNWYVSIPIESMDSTALSTAAQAILIYDEPTASWKSPTSATLSSMKGYISASTKNTGAVTFSGTLNDGTKTATLSRTYGVAKSGFNLVGNPYPSYVSWDVATKSNLETTMWYRSKNAGNTAYVFDTYNAESKIGTGNNGEIVNSNIPPMQAFWVRVKAPVLTHDTIGTLTFDNSMRSHKGSSDVRMKSPAVQNVAQQVLRLQVSNGVNSDEAIVLFNDNASNDLDAFDSYKMSNENSVIPEIYTTIGTDNLVINGLNSFVDNTELPLGFNTGTANVFTLKATQLTNFDNIEVILRDKIQSIDEVLTTDATYTFSSGVTNTTSRFSLLFRVKGTTTDVIPAKDPGIQIQLAAAHIIVRSSDLRTQAYLTIYNSVGQKVQNLQLSKTETRINLPSGVYMINIRKDGKNINRKVIIK